MYYYLSYITPIFHDSPILAGNVIEKLQNFNHFIHETAITLVFTKWNGLVLCLVDTIEVRNT